MYNINNFCTEPNMTDTKSTNGVMKIATIEIPELTAAKCPKVELKEDAKSKKEGKQQKICFTN